MSGASGGEWSVTTWGIDLISNDDGMENWQRWRIRKSGKLVAHLSLPMTFSARDVLVMVGGGVNKPDLTGEYDV